MPPASGGRALIVDIRHLGQYERTFRASGCPDARLLDSRLSSALLRRVDPGRHAPEHAARPQGLTRLRAVVICGAFARRARRGRRSGSVEEDVAHAVPAAGLWRVIRHRGWLSAAPMLGLLAMIVPVVWSRAPVRQDVPLFPLLDHAVEHVGPWQLGLLVLAGVFVGTLCDRRPLVIGLATVAVLPLAAIAEMFADKTSHNMFPFEFAIYAFYGCLAAVGAFVAQRWRQRGAGDAAGGGPGGRAGA